MLTNTQRLSLVAAHKAKLTISAAAKHAGASSHTVIIWFALFRYGHCYNCDQPYDHPDPCPGLPIELTNEICTKVRALRVDDDLLDSEICDRVPGLSRSQVSKLLRGLPLKHRRRKSEIWWTPEEIASLHTLYPTAAWEDLITALPNRKRQNIEHKAATLGIRRDPDLGVMLPDDPILRQLRRERQQAGLTAVALAKRVSIPAKTRDPRSKQKPLGFATITHVELGLSSISLRQLHVWAAALGLKLTLVPIPEITYRTEPAPQYLRPNESKPIRITPHSTPTVVAPKSANATAAKFAFKHRADDDIDAAIAKFQANGGEIKRLPSSTEMVMKDPANALVRNASRKWERPPPSSSP